MNKQNWGWAIVVVFIVGVIEVILSGMLIAQTWHWFIMPIVPLDLAPLSIAQAVGLTYFFRLFIATPERKNDFKDCKTPTELIAKVTTIVIVYYIGWFALAWLIHQFVI